MTLKLNETNSQNAFRYGYLLNKLYPYIKPVMGRIILGILIAIPLGLLDGVVAFALKPYMDYVINGMENAKLFHFLVTIFPFLNKQGATLQDIFALIIPFLVVGFALVQGVIKYASSYLTEWTGNKISNSLKVDLFKKLTSLDPKFYDINSSGLVLQRFLCDPDVASKSIINNLKSFISTIFGIIGLVAVLLYNSWQLAIIGVTVMGIAITPVALIRNRIKRVSNAQMVVVGDMTTGFNETFGGNKIMTSYNLQGRQNSTFESQINDQFNLQMSLVKRVGWMSPIMYFVCSIGIAIVMAVGNHLIMEGYMTAGSFASFVTSLLLLYKPTRGLGESLTNLQTTFVAMCRVFELFDINPEITTKENAVKISDVRNNIEFKDVTFEYVEDTPVLKNFSLTVNKNETIALVGNSGGGKSTVVNLIPRFYDVKSGSVKIDGVDVRDIQLESLRDNVASVFQDNFLFTGSIRDNIMMGNESATENQLQEVIKMAHLDEFIDTLENGLDTEVGERGTSLSGGQRQRVAIARAMLKDAPIIILDEATSALDNQSEAVVQKALDNLIQNKTVFVIAHRLTTIKNAHRIAVINEGELAELGTHEELMNIEKGKYKHLYEMQFSKGEVAAL